MKHELYFDRSIDKWDEAVPIGNGRTGALIWGTPQELRFSLDRTDIWDISEPLYTDREDYTYETLIGLAKEGKRKEIQDLFDASYGEPAPTKLPAGKLVFGFPEGKNVRSRLSLQDAQAQLWIEEENKELQISAICHAVTKSGMIRIAAEKGSFSMELQNPEFGTLDMEEQAEKKSGINKGSLKLLRYPRPSVNRQEGTPEFRWFTQEITEEFSFGVVVGILEKPEETLVFYRVVISKDGENWVEDAKAQLAEELAVGYAANLESHKKWWQDYWAKSAVSLPDEMFEKYWYLTNYLFASCSRKGEYPMPLQGVWTADNGELPPWKGDYHNDLNTQLSYSHFFKANHLEEGESFIDFLWNSREAAAAFAKKFYKTEGICFPGVMSIDGKPLGGWPMYSCSPTHQIWLCQSFELYYTYMQDEDFLREKAWVFFEETAKCITGLLVERDGLYYLPASSSPEIHDDELEAWLTPNSNYDLALMRYLFKTLVRFAKILDNGQAEKWQQIYEKLPELAVNEKNVLMLSPDESLKESHRHLSNAMAISPLKLYHYDTHQEIIDATVLDYEYLGSGMWVGFSFPWMSHLYSIQGNGEGAYEQLRIFWDSFCSPNGFHLNGDYKKRGCSTFHYRPFTLEANMFAADALQEMLLQVIDDEIQVFPAIPEKWKKETVSFEKFLGEGGFVVSAEQNMDKNCQVKICAKKSGKVKVRWKQMTKEVQLQAGQISIVSF